MNDDIDIKTLMENVRKECGNKSDLYVIANHPSYKQIILNGKKSLPYLLEDLSMIWIYALEEITGEKLNYISTDSEDIKNEWKKWAIQNGY